MPNREEFINHLEKINFKSIKDVPFSWKQIGALYGFKNGDQARLTWNYYKRDSLSKNSQIGYHVVLGCIHVPFQHNKALENILQLMVDIKPVGFHLAGDFLDCNSLSGYDRGKFPIIPGLNLEKEYEYGSHILDLFDSVLSGDVNRNFLYGNHEARFHTYMSKVDNSKVAARSPEDALQLEQRGYNIYTDWKNDQIQLPNDTVIIHGENFSKHFTEKNLMTYKRNVISSHTHRHQVFAERRFTSIGTGILGDMDNKVFKYMSRQGKEKWKMGFVCIYVDQDKNYFHPVIVEEDGSFVFGNKVYK